MARGLSQAMAASTNASDSAGSSPRSRRARASAPRSAELLAAVSRLAAVISGRVAEGGLDDLLFGQFVATQIGDDAAVLEDIDMVAIVEFLGFRGVPEEGAAAASLLAHEVVDFQLGADVDAAHRIVHQHDLGIGAERAGKQRLLLV